MREGLINQATTGILEQWRAKNVVAQFIGRDGPDKLGNYEEVLYGKGTSSCGRTG